MRFLTRPEVRERFAGKTVAIVGSGPGVLDNAPGFIDDHQVVVRVNNYRCINPHTGYRADVHYSFYGTSIRKTAEQLKGDSVTLCMCKCPDAHAIDSDWHRRRRMMIGVDYRPHYRRRQNFWFCDTYIPSTQDFLASFNLLGGHVPTTGFAAILDILSFEPAKVHLTGFDFFRSKIHNVNEPWRGRHPDDPIRHVPEREMAWLAANAPSLPISLDEKLGKIIKEQEAAA